MNINRKHIYDQTRSIVKDSVTGIEGKLTHLSLDMAGNSMVNFRPNTLKPDTGEVSESFWVTPNRIVDFDPSILIKEFPATILGTKVADKSNGFTGVAIEFILHLNGCVHVIVQPAGIDKKTGTRFKHEQFDLRELTGDKIKKLTDAELDASKQRKPSPSPFKSHCPGK